MTDNVFDRLFELLQSSGPVNWKLAREVATSLSGQAEPIEPRLAEEYIELTRVAEFHVERASGLPAAPAAAAVNPVDRHRWATDNLEAFAYLVEPMAEKLGDMGGVEPFGSMLKPLGPALVGMQIGSLVGLMSHRVLGQFDTGLPPLGRSGLYYVVPNAEAFAVDHGIDPAQARLWVALQEVTHHTEYAVPWVRGHLEGLVRRYLGSLRFDPAALTERFESMQDPEELESFLQQPGAALGLVSGEGHREALEQIQAFVALIEGYADHLMDRAAPDLIPETPRIREAMNRRRAEPSEGEQALQGLVGLELRRDQYRLGSGFCAEVERRWGREQLAAIWEGPEHLPTGAELEDPVGWAARQL